MVQIIISLHFESKIFKDLIPSYQGCSAQISFGGALIKEYIKQKLVSRENVAKSVIVPLKVLLMSRYFACRGWHVCFQYIIKQSTPQSILAKRFYR